MATLTLLTAPTPTGTIECEYGKYYIQDGKVTVDSRIVLQLVQSGFSLTTAGSEPVATVERPGVVKPDDVTLKVDADGKLYATAKAARYIVAANQAARLALGAVPNLTIAQQVDTSRMWFLNADLDPSVAGNWVDGGSTSAGVNSFNTRTGLVVPVVGDYLAYLTDFVKARGYTTGEVVRGSDGLVYVANGPVASGTDFAVGTTGATFKRLIPVATTTSEGVMSAADKTKLDGIASGATAIALATATPQALGTGAVGTSTKAAREDHVHDRTPNANTTTDGLMSKDDKTKLDGIAAGATAVTLASATPSALGTAAVGTSTKAAREDHVHALPGSASTTAAGLMSAADKTKLDGLVGASAMSGASTASAGTGGTVPAPAAGDNSKYFTGGGSYSYPLLPWTKKAWNKGDRCLLGPYVIEANAAIADTVDFTWGTTGATWKLLLPTTYNWKGLYALSTAYSERDVVVHSTGIASPPMVFISAYTSPASGSLVGDTRSIGGTGTGLTQVYMYPSNLTFVEFKMVGASQTRQGAIGLVPEPPAGFQNAALRGDGTYRPLDFLFSRLANNQSVGAGAVGTRVAFSVGNTLARGSITIDSAGFSFNLKANRVYWLEFHGSGDMGGGGDTRFRWYDDTAAVYLGTENLMYPTSGTGNGFGQPVAAALYTPAVDSVVTCRAIQVVSSSVIYSGSSFAKIVEMW